MVIDEIWLFKFPDRALFFLFLVLIFIFFWREFYKKIDKKIVILKWSVILLAFLLINLLPNDFPPVYDTYYHFQNSIESLDKSRFELDHYHYEWPGFFLIGGALYKISHLKPVIYLKAFYTLSTVIFLLLLFEFISSLSKIIYIKEKNVPIIFLISVIINSWVQLHYSPQSFANIFALLFFINIIKDIKCEKSYKKLYLLENILILIILIPSHPPTFIFLYIFYLLYFIMTRIFYYENLIYTKTSIIPLFTIPLWVTWLFVFARKTLIVIKESFFRMDISNIKYFISGKFESGLFVFDICSNILTIIIVLVSLWQIFIIIKRYKTYKINYELFLSSYTIVFFVSLILIILLNINFSDRPLFYLSLIIPLVLFKEYRIERKIIKKIIIFMIITMFVLGFIFFHKNYYPNLISRDEIEAGILMNYTAEESAFLFHPHNHFKKIDGYYYFSENSKYWHTKEEFYFRKKLLERKKVFYSNGTVKIYSD